MKKLVFSTLLLFLAAASISAYGQELNAVKRGIKWGFIDATGKVIIPFEYKEAREFAEGLAAVKLKNRWGFIDKTGKVVIPFQYYYARNFSEGLAAVQSGPYWGFIDKTGKEIVPCKYYFDVRDFSEGFAAVYDGGYRWGYVDKTGKMVIPFNKYKYVWNFSGGLAAVNNKNKWGYIDKTGKEVVPIIHFDKYEADMAAKRIRAEIATRVREERERAEQERAEQERIANLFSTFAKAYVEPRIKEWEKKGEFETTATWQQRVNETTRREQTARFTQEAEERYVAEQVKKQPAIDLSLGFTTQIESIII